MSLSRRNLLRAIAAVAGSGAAGVSPGQIARAASLPLPVAAPDCEDDPDCARVGPIDPCADDWFGDIRQTLTALNAEADRYRGYVRLPEHIAHKRSWSPVYKEHLAHKEYARLMAMIDDMHNPKTGKRLLQLLLSGGAS